MKISYRLYRDFEWKKTKKLGANQNAELIRTLRRLKMDADSGHELTVTQCQMHYTGNVHIVNTEPERPKVSKIIARSIFSSSIYSTVIPPDAINTGHNT